MRRRLEEASAISIQSAMRGKAARGELERRKAEKDKQQEEEERRRREEEQRRQEEQRWAADGVQTRHQAALAMA
jgi:hypothetical protein